MILMIGLNTSWANLYNCTEASRNPVLIPAVKESIKLSTTSPYLKSYFNDSQFHQNKTPFLIYYAIDSAEAFMQYSVKFEIAKLQQSGLKSPHVNFVGILNSLYVEKNQIIICKNQKISYLNLNTFPLLNESLTIKRKFISTGDHTENETGPILYRVRYFQHSNKPFGQFPLAHPDFLHDLVKLITTEKTLFPTEQYIPFLNLKSHGSKLQVLAGMNKCQSKAKVLSAEKVLSNVLTKNEIRFLKKINNQEKVLSNLDKFEEIISKLQLGSESGTGEDYGLGSSRLGSSRLAFETNGLGDAIHGLGVNEGLGIEFSFGTKQVHLNWALGDLFENKSERVLGFLMLESCDTNRDPEFFHSYIDNVLGYYSAKHSLWYRNLNWWTLLERAKGSSQELINILKIETSKIPNIEVLKN